MPGKTVLECSRFRYDVYDGSSKKEVIETSLCPTKPASNADLDPRLPYPILILP